MKCDNPYLLEICAEYTYDAFGNATVYTHGEIDYDSDVVYRMNPFLWKGHYYDWEIGYYYIDGRYYDPEIYMYIDSANPEAVIAEMGSVYGLNPNAIMRVSPHEVIPNLFNSERDIQLFYDSPDLNWWQCVKRDVGLWIQRNQLLLGGAGKIITGVVAVATGILTLAAACTPVGWAIVAVTAIVSGSLTVYNGMSDIGENYTGYNVIRELVFGGSQKGYNWYSGTT